MLAVGAGRDGGVACCRVAFVVLFDVCGGLALRATRSVGAGRCGVGAERSALFGAGSAVATLGVAYWLSPKGKRV